MLGQKFNQKNKNGLGIKINSKNSSLGNKIQPNKLKSNLFSFQNQENKKSYLEK